MLIILTLALLAAASPPSVSVFSDHDTDGDGLSDFHETHKYGTDPTKADSDGDGIHDGDPAERREYAYTVRSIVQVLKPVTPEYLTDDFQDARVLFEGDDYVELEVIHYPFSTVNETIEADDDWRQPTDELKRWLKPGLTSDWDDALRRELTNALAKDEIDVTKLNDKQVVEQAARWLLQHAKHNDGFTTFLTSFDQDGHPFVSPQLQARAEKESAASGTSVAEQWQREVFARGMFKAGTRGSCSSSSIYLSGCLRSLGIPTRTVLCIPLVDANDERERELASTRLLHNSVRTIVEDHAERGIGAWTSHTFNEVWVGGRWRRLNYDKLGQGILDSHYLGLMTHVATFHDWADARMPETIGRRHQLPVQDELFGGPNPYSTISLSDQFGAHCKTPNPPRDEERLTIVALRWTDDPELPAHIVQHCVERDRFGLIALVEQAPSFTAFKSFIASVDRSFQLKAPGHPMLDLTMHPQSFWRNQITSDLHIYIPLSAKDQRELRDGVEYEARALNQSQGLAWSLELTVHR